MKITRLFAAGAATLSVAALTTASAMPARAQDVPETPDPTPIVTHVQTCVELNASRSCASDIIVFAGQTTSLSPPVGLTPVADGAGSYTFTCDLACVSYSDGDSNVVPPTAPEVGVSGFSVPDGKYGNEVCGTGEATGTATIAPAAAPEWVGETEATMTVAFHIWFNAGVGVVEGSVTSTDDANGNVFGVVDISAAPVVQGDCVNGVTQFNAVGAAGVAEPATGS